MTHLLCCLYPLHVRISGVKIRACSSCIQTVTYRDVPPKDTPRLQVTKERAIAPINMTTSTAGLLANMHGSVTEQLSNADSVYDTIQAFHGGSTSSSAVTPSQQARQIELSPPDIAAFSGESAAQSSTANQTQNSSMAHSQCHRPLFTASVETG